MEVRRGLTPGGGAIPSLLAALVGISAIAGFVVSRKAMSNPRGPQAQTVASAEAASITADLETDAALLTAAGEAVRGDPARAADLSQLSPLDPAAALTVVGLGDPLTAQPQWQLALELARDGGGTIAAAAPDPTGAWTLLEVQALYGAQNPTQVGDRRDFLKGYVVLMEPVGSLAGLPPADIGENVAARLLQGTTVLNRYGASTGSGPSGTPAKASVSANGTDWTVEAWSVGHPPRTPWVILFGGLILAALVGAVATIAEHRSGVLATEASARAGELALVARTATLLQESLDLAELLPLFVVEVSDDLGLEAVTLSRLTESGRLVKYFSLGSGTAPDAREAEASVLASLPDEVPPGGTITVPLQRAGRIVGAISAIAPKGLTPSQIDALRAVCDLLAAAVGNARLFQQEQEMVGKLQELDRLKTTFLGSVSHELRTTVTAIEGFAGLLTTQSAVLDEERRMDFIARIRRNARSLGVLVEDLLDFARMERGGLSMTVQPVDLGEQVSRVIEQMQSILGDRRVQLVMTPGIVVAADPSAIERILSNLLSNAAKYTPPGSQVEVAVARDGDSGVLSVSDQGPGIPAEERDRIFDLFYRGRDEASRNARGVGIGLALARQLVELLSGTISAGEARGGGARFDVTIPLYPAEPMSVESRVSEPVVPR